MFEFWLKDEKNNIEILLPVTPSRYDLDYGNEIETVRATEIGDINLVGYKRLISVQLEGFFTSKQYPFVNKSVALASSPMEYIDKIKKWVDEKSIIRLVISNESETKINKQFFVENIKYSENSQSNGDIDYIISLREFRQMQVVFTSNTGNVYTNNNRPQTKDTPKNNSYAVVGGDNLSKIARKMYGDANKWTKIYEANKNIIGKNPNIIYVGQIYTIPS